VDIGGGEDGRVSNSAGSGAVAPVGYAEQVKVQVRTSRVQAARAVDTALVGLPVGAESVHHHQVSCWVVAVVRWIRGGGAVDAGRWGKRSGCVGAAGAQEAALLSMGSCAWDHSGKPSSRRAAR